MTADIAAFIRARLDEWEALAREAPDNELPWSIEAGRDGRPTIRTGGMGWETATGSGIWGCDDPYDDCFLYRLQDEQDADHIVAHDPASVLRQVAALRAVVDLHESWPVLVKTALEIETVDDDPSSLAMRASQKLAWLTQQEYRARFGDEPPTAPMLAHIATIWADHPDYAEEWKP